LSLLSYFLNGYEALCATPPMVFWILILFPNKESIIFLTENSCCIWLFSKPFWVVTFSSKNSMYYKPSFWLKTDICQRSVTSWVRISPLLTRVTCRDILDCRIICIDVLYYAISMNGSTRLLLLEDELRDMCNLLSVG
jgi:hypothetical protein